MDQRQSLLAVLNDLFFRVKIEGPARQAGWQLTFASTVEEAMERARNRPALIVADLNAAGLDVLGLIGMLKQDEQTRGIPVIAFVSHVQTQLRQQAIALGCEQVIVRSALARELPKLLAVTYDA